MDDQLLDQVVDFSTQISSLEQDEDIQICDVIPANNPSSSERPLERNNNNNDDSHNIQIIGQYKSKPEDNIPKYNLEQCSICFSDPPINAINLKCGHVFCFLCVKGAAENNNRCPMCRSEISDDFWHSQHKILGATRIPTATQDGKYWFYEAYDGWWMYDPETAKEIESAYQSKSVNHQQLIAGFMYTVDFDKMIQRRSDGYSRARKIKRSSLHLPNIKGVGGIKNDDLLSTIKLLQNSH